VLLGEGLEGCVYEIDEERVAKVRFAASMSALSRIGPLYERSTRPLGQAARLCVPQVLELVDSGERRITVERRLVGASLAERVGEGSVSGDDARARFVEVLAALADSGPLPEGRTLTVMDEPEPLYHETEDFPEALARLATSRRNRFAATLDAAVDDVDAKAEALVQRLEDVDSRRRTVLHGDLHARLGARRRDPRPRVVRGLGCRLARQG
jgi:hypothetical protein